jgi:hypothetical protein
MATMQGESFAAKPISASLLARRRKTAAPDASRPTRLQTFFPRSMLRTEIVIISSLRLNFRRTHNAARRGGPSHKAHQAEFASPTTARHQAAAHEGAGAIYRAGRASGSLRCAIAPTQIAERLGPLGVVTSEQLFDPSLAEGCCCRHLRNRVTSRQKPDHLENAAMRWRPDIERTALPTSPRSNACRLSPCVKIPRLMALQTICFARPRESPFIVESISRKPY